jgi:hypothetical protein
MKFFLTYDGPLPSSANGSKKKAEIWDIRTEINEQLDELWKVHPSLLLVSRQSFQFPRQEGYLVKEEHHSNNPTSGVPLPPPGDDFYALTSPVQICNIWFRSLVRDSLGLVCGLDILFLRKGPKGRVYQGGDLDNRIKTLLDALRIPSEQEVAATKFPNGKPGLLTALLEDDKLVTALNVRTGQLLNRPGAPESEVRLTIEVDIKVTHPRSYNQTFLGD